MKADMSGAAAKLSRIAKDRGLGQFLASEAQRGMGPFVPFRTGALEASAVATPFKVTYTAEYATYPYHGRGTIRQEHHPNATSRWDRAYAAAHGQELGDAGTEYVRAML